MAEQTRLEPESNSPSCAACHEKVFSKFPTDPPNLTNPKIEKMLQILHRKESIRRRAGKTAIICQFPAFADLIAQHLAEEGIDFVSFYDSNVNEKAAAMRRIRREQNVTVALITINPVTTLGLDLRPFDTVFLMDLWWNPRLDAAAFEADHDVRVKIYKLYFNNSVESRILEPTPQAAEPTAAGR
ncbi:hypothetical protein FRC00_001710 [Tulasnella sp. 408]|nr:hypothetical protein FRC00_001710 [Tulasnella sp. 408]